MHILRWTSILLGVLVVNSFSAGNAHSQATSPNVTLSLPGNGADMWTGVMARRGYFRPHGVGLCDSVENNPVDPTEVFVPMLPNNLGYCIEIDERPGLTFPDARDACLQDGKRLPEVTEYVYACQNASLNNATNDYEWGSNFPVLLSASSQTAVQLIGNGGCTIGSFDSMASPGGAGIPRPFRCVR